MDTNGPNFAKATSGRHESKKRKSSANKEVSLVRSSAAEYLTFVAATGKGGVEAVYADENIWLTQKMMGALYDVETHTINYHLKKVFSDSELQEESVFRRFRITAADGKNYSTNHYNLSAIIAVGYKVNSERAVQFRKWATHVIKEYTIKAYVMDDERIKNGGSILTEQYFEEQLQRIREIRLSERKFYQKITITKLMKGNYEPCSRNPTLAQYLGHLHLMEQRGSGIRRMQDAMARHGLDSPEYAFRDGYFVVRLKGPADDLDRLRLPEGRLAPGPADVEEHLTKRQKEIAEWLASGDAVTNRECQERFGISKVIATKDLAALVATGVAERTGRGRSVRYVYRGGKR